MSSIVTRSPTRVTEIGGCCSTIIRERIAVMVRLAALSLSYLVEI